MDIRKLNYRDTIPIRHKVLWPNEDIKYCDVEGDNNALHFGVFFDTTLICVASLFLSKDSAQLRKFATLNEYQGKGAGTFMLNHLINESKRIGAPYLWLDARESAVDFYRKFGFTVTGKCFYKKSIPYFKMYKKIL